MNKKNFILEKMVLSSVCFGVLLAGCSSSKDAIEDVKAKDAAPTATTARKLEPVTLKFFSTATTEASFNIRFKAVVEKAYPHITLQWQSGKIDELAAANNLPDMVYGQYTVHQDLLMDLDSLIKQNKMDTIIKPRIWEAYVYMTETDKKILMPFQANGYLVHVNKDIFDRFGAPYPKDGMTWDETYELAKKVSRVENGLNYMGFNVTVSQYFLNTQLELPYIDDKTGKASVNNESWKNYMANISRFFTTQGNKVTRADNSLAAYTNKFLKEKVVAMYLGASQFTNLAEDKEVQMNWDIVSMPIFPEVGKQGSQPNTSGLGIIQSSKLKEDAFLVIQTMVSEQTQTFLSRLGSPTVLTNDAVPNKDFAKDLPGAAGKNFNAYFYNNYAPSRKPNIYNSKVKGVPSNAITSVIYGEKDINTALRDAEEEMNLIIEKEKALTAK